MRHRYAHDDQHGGLDPMDGLAFDDGIIRDTLTSSSDERAVPVVPHHHPPPQTPVRRLGGPDLMPGQRPVGTDSGHELHVHANTLPHPEPRATTDRQIGRYGDGAAGGNL